NIDKMLLETDKRNIEVILVVGRKQPRWPECHQPNWYGALSPEDKKTAQLTMIKTAVEHFKSHKSIAMWQVENEPLFDFGPQCPRTVTSFLREQVALVKSLDSRPVLISDSGELGRWLPSARVGDILGSTMYRKIHNPKLGYIQYPLPPAFFKLKSGFVKFFTGKPIIGVELQAEPWYVTDVHQTDLVRQKELMNVDIFNDNVAYATEVGFPQNYLWGVEWWYWLGIKHGDWSMWQAAQKVLQE
ncbi:MAG TPA: hypothetical protein VEA37_09215, partial [Flavobacterium sp.]|nr:hypothetical protein [Flavobacterium sp.]